MIGTAPTMTIGENMLLAELRGKRGVFPMASLPHAGPNTATSLPNSISA